ncbi:MAG: homoserine O-acetyltransferase/O-succinyltransferase family protein, partial [Collinsella aerofaciens]
VDYWPELCQIMDWSTTHVHSTLHICWGAQAGLYHHYGIQKYDLPAKASGVFEHYLVKPQSPLVRGFDDRFYAVHSRNTDVRREDVEAEPQLEVVAVSDEVGLYIVKSTDSRRFFVFGHPEYDTDTLRLEYERDVKRGLNLVRRIFPNDDPTAEPRNVWRSQLSCFTPTGSTTTSADHALRPSSRRRALGYGCSCGCCCGRFCAWRDERVFGHTSVDFRTFTNRAWIISHFWLKTRLKTGDYPRSFFGHVDADGSAKRRCVQGQSRIWRSLEPRRVFLSDNPMDQDI